MLTVIAFGLAFGFFGTILIAAHRAKVPILELTKDDILPKE